MAPRGEQRLARGRRCRGRRDIERAAGASTVGGPDSPPNSPLPKRLRVRLEASKEKHSAHAAHLERRLRLAERIQVRARANPRFRVFPPITPFRSPSGARGAGRARPRRGSALSPPDPHPSRGARPLPDSTTRARPRTRPVPNVVAPASWSEPPESGRVVAAPGDVSPGVFLQLARRLELRGSLRGSSLRRDRRVSRLDLLHDPALRGIHAILGSPSSVTPRSPHCQEDVIERDRARARAEANLRARSTSPPRRTRASGHQASRLARRLATADANRDALMRRRVDTAARALESRASLDSRRRGRRGERSPATSPADKRDGIRRLRRDPNRSRRDPNRSRRDPGRSRVHLHAASPSTTFALARRFASARVHARRESSRFRRVRREARRRPETLRECRVLARRAARDSSRAA